MTEQERWHEALRRNAIALDSRYEALVVYGLLGISVGMAMLFDGVPPIISGPFPAATFIFGSLALVGGSLAMASGLMGDIRVSWWIGLVGVILLGVWAEAFSLAYFAGMLVPHDGPDTSRAYVPFLYQGLAFTFALHARTFIKLRRPV